MTPLACPHCHDGEIDVPTCAHSGNCPCGTDSRPCLDCGGTGFVECDGCPEPAVTDVDGQRLCLACSESAALEPAA